MYFQPTFLQLVLSLSAIFIGLGFLFSVFIISSGLFLYENWCKQEYTIHKTKRMLPVGCSVQSIDYDAENKKYTIRVEYMSKTFRISVIYPILNITQKGCGATVIRLDSKNEFLEKSKSVILNYMTFSKYHCTICGFPLCFAPWGKDKNSPTHDICPCCGVEWGNEDYTRESRIEYRNKWLAAGAKWFESQKKPTNWNLEEQLKNIISVR